MKTLAKVTAAVIIAAVIITLANSIASAEQLAKGPRYHTCDKVVCLGFDRYGRPAYSKLYGVKYRRMIPIGTKVYGTKLSSGLLKQSMFRSESRYYRSADFK
jgi:hypothetical protein